MSQASHDIWSKWLHHRRDGGDPDRKRKNMELLRSVREKVLDNAKLKEGDTLIDVGCGEGLIAFGALERARTVEVIFCDVSQDLLDIAQSIAKELALEDRCRFLNASADDLSQLKDASVSVLTTRSVLIYVADKASVFREFHRILQPGGRLSLFEPINSFGSPLPDHIFAGYDVSEVVQLAHKVKEVYQRAQPDENNPMIDFDERNLIRFAEDAGFEELHLRLEVDIEPNREDVSWDAFFRSAPNPLAPTLEEAISQALSLTESKEFLDHLRAMVEQRRGIRKMAVAYLWAVKSGNG
jgi:ubiquinone/menaquinone biosynthesis C-methylase UbiE